MILKKLVKIDDNGNSAKHIHMLNDYLIVGLNEGKIYQHYGAPCHRLRATQQSLVDEGVTALTDRPAHSPDLNIIEQVWTELERKVHKKKTRNLEEL